MIVHICGRSEWQEGQAAGRYRAESLDTEGFIHCSRPGQILDVANQFYVGTKDLVMLCIDPRLLDAELRWEQVGEDVFPHLYGAINPGAVINVREFPADDDGIFRILPEC